MIYREQLVMRKALMWYFIVVFAMCAWTTLWLWGQSTPDSHSSTDLSMITPAIAWSASVFPAIFGVALGNGSRDASRVLWTLPAARWVFALRTIAVDLGATVVAFAGTFAFAVLVFVVRGLHEHTELRGSIDWPAVVTAVVFLFAVYGFSALAGMLGRRVAYLGIAAYPILLVWWALSRSPSPIGQMLRVPVILNPIAVYDTNGPQVFVTLAVLFVLSSGTAIYLWQRAEVLN
jgi:hypothetical protein